MAQCIKTLVQGGCRPGGCGTPALPEAIERRIAEHPCYSESAQHRFARLHLAVAPACNIQCHYCNRKYDCANESRPGVVSELLTPEQAVKKALVVGARLPQLAVVGIAGPGDPLANPERTLATLRMLSEQAPDLKLCVSTNGLMLPEYAEALARYRVEHVTITINCLDPDIGAQIYPWIFWRHRRVRGRTAAAILIERQQEGLERLVEHGILVKVNSVLIPGINDAHLPEVSRVIRAKGAFLHNIMPLISAPEHGTFYGLTGQRGPTPEELEAVQAACGGEMRLMRHCQQCRADAVGLLGEDRGGEFGLDQIEGVALTNELLAAAQSRRAAFRAQVAREQPIIPLHRTPRAAEGPGRPVRMAVAAKKGRISEHFGQVCEFLVYEVSSSGVRLVDLRQVEPYCQGPLDCGGPEDALEQIIHALAGCEVVLCAKIGYEPWERLRAAGIQPNSDHPDAPIAQACLAVWQEMLETGRLAKPAVSQVA